MVGRYKRKYNKESFLKLQSTIYRTFLLRNPYIDKKVAWRLASISAKKHAEKMTLASQIYHQIKRELLLNENFSRQIKSIDLSGIRCIIQKLVMNIIREFELYENPLRSDQIKAILPIVKEVGIKKCGLPNNIVKYVMKRTIELLRSMFESEMEVKKLCEIIETL